MKPTPPPPVTAARVIIYVFGALAALGALALVAFGLMGIISGAAVAGGSVGTDSASLGSAFGGLIGVFSGAVLAFGLVGMAFVALWFWAATALGRASRAARIVVTVLSGLSLANGLFALAASLSDSSTSGAGLVVLAVVAVPALLVVLLWGPESSRRFFTPAAAVWQHPGWAQPAPPSPPVGVAMPGRYDEPVTTPLRLPALCAACGCALQPAGVFCGGCGAPVAPART